MRAWWLVLMAGCSGTSFEDLGLTVDFEASAAATSAAVQTPGTYRVALHFVDLLGPSPFEVMRTGGAVQPEVLSFTAGDAQVESLVPDGVELPADPFNEVALGIVYLEMDLPFRLDSTGEEVTRTLRIWFEPDGTHMPGDVAVVDGAQEGRAFGPGNLSADPDLTGLASRDAAYGSIDAWEGGRDPAISGPFGNAFFWDTVQTAPFTWTVPVPDGVSDTAVVTVKVADTWHFTDQDDDGVYDWPSDYGEAWSMDFPAFEVVEGVSVPENGPDAG